jgi:hypothetical protein
MAMTRGRDGERVGGDVRLDDGVRTQVDRLWLCVSWE